MDDSSDKRRGPTRRERSTQGDASGPQPRLPAERDESADSQARGEASAETVGEQGFKDLEHGLEDTSLGPVTDRTYHELGAAPSASAPPPRRVRKR